MSQLILLCLFMLWMLWRPTAEPDTQDLALRVGLFFAVYTLLVAALAVWSRLVARQTSIGSLHRSVGRFNRSVRFARWLVPAWFGVGLWYLGWGDLMQAIFPARDSETIVWLGMKLPTVTLGILPGILTWMGLWWAQFPADCALREANVLNQLEADLPVTATPRFRDYFSANFRMQVLFICLPLLAVVGLRDLMTHAWVWYGGADSPTSELVVVIASVATVFLLAPPALTKILSTEPLPDSPLRRRLELLCKQSGVKYREILLWNTHHHVCNAGVMGMFAPVRYVLMTDALLGSLTDDQIEAVFAHELGHVVHRHLIWYSIFWALLLTVVSQATSSLELQSDKAAQAVQFASAGAMLWVFGYLSRCCERQADVYAARTLEWLHGPTTVTDDSLVMTSSDVPAPLSPVFAGGDDGQPFRPVVQPSLAMALASRAMAAPPSTRSFSPPVGRHGAALFSSALHRVAVVNNIPLARHEWLHGSILRRVNFLRRLAREPATTPQFDRQMTLLHALLLIGFVASLLWWGVSLLPAK